MRTGSRLGVYALGVVAVFGLAAAAGASLGPIGVGASSDHSDMSPQSPTVIDVGLTGLTTAADGFRLVTDVEAVEAGKPSVFTFRIERSDGSTVTDFDLLNDRRMHLIVLSRNLVDYLHTHPVLGADGTWNIDLPAMSPGSYRVYADFRSHGADQITLATDVSVPGLVEAFDLPAVSPSNEVDGFTVSLSGMAAMGESTFVFDVARNGAAVVTEPYLGAAGHLVVIREGDLGYLHVHPLDGAAGPVRFAAEFPTPGTYRLFFDFSSGGTVRTASFTVVAERSGAMTTDPSMSNTHQGQSP